MYGRTQNFGKYSNGIHDYGSAYYLPPLEKPASNFSNEYDGRMYSRIKQVDGNLTDEGAEARLSQSNVR